MKDDTDPITAPRLRLSMIYFSDWNDFSVSISGDDGTSHHFITEHPWRLQNYYVLFFALFPSGAILTIFEAKHSQLQMLPISICQDCDLQQPTLPLLQLRWIFNKLRWKFEKIVFRKNKKQNVTEYNRRIDVLTGIVAYMGTDQTKDWSSVLRRRIQCSSL